MPRLKPAPVRNAAQDRLHRDEPIHLEINSQDDVDSQDNIIDLIDDAPVYNDSGFHDPFVRPIIRPKTKPRKKQKVEHESGFKEFLNRSNYYIPVKSKFIF